MSDSEKFEKWLREHDSEDYCKYCIYDDDCPHGMTCYGGDPIEPPCAGNDIRNLLDIDAIIKQLEDKNE